LLRLGSNGRSSLAAENQRRQLFAHDSSPRRSRIVGVFSIARRNETMCSTRCDAHPPRRSAEIEITTPNRLRAAAGLLSSALVRVVSTVSGFFHRFALEAEMDSRSDGNNRCGENHAAELPSRSTCSPAQRATTWIAPTLQMRLFSYQRGNGLIDPTHQFARMPPTMY